MDDIQVTFVQAASAFSGTDGTVCSSDGYMLSEATAENYVSLLWTTSGDGSFDDASSLNPEYMPGSEDAAGAEVTLTLTATGNTGCDDAVSELILAVEPAPEAFAGEDNAILPGASYTLSDATAMHYNNLAWATSGDGSFDDATSMNPTYTPGSNDIEAKEVTLSLTAGGTDPCGEVMDEMMLSINTGIGENAMGFELNVFPNPNSGNFTLELNGSRNETISIRIYNALGDEVYARENIDINGSHQESINLNIEPGIYYVRIEGEELLINKKIMVQK